MKIKIICFKVGGNGTGMKTVSMNSYVESSSTTLQAYESERLHKRTNDVSFIIITDIIIIIINVTILI